MTTLIINSESSLSNAIGAIREAFNIHKYVKVTTRTGKNRTLPQNDVSHVWYEQLARELREDDELGFKCFCKLHFGVPILRAEDSEFRELYDRAIKDTLSYEQKLSAMKVLPVTSRMTKEQLSKYLEAMQAHFLKRGVILEFPQ